MDSFIGEVRILPYTYAPENWALCDGQMLPISQNQALYTVIGKTYGGDGVTTFAVPNLSGAAPVGSTAGGARTQTGAQSVALAANDLPAHNHTWTEQVPGAPTDLVVTASGNSLSHGEVLNGGGANANLSFFTFGAPPASGQAALFPVDMLSVTGLNPSTPHDNMQPYLVMNFCISLAGDYPVKP